MAIGTQPSPRVAKTEQRRDEFIHRQLNQARRKVRRIELGTTLLGLFVGVLLYLLLLAVVDHWLLPLGALGRWLALLSLLGCSGAYAYRYVLPLLLHTIHPLYAARTIERGTPTLKNSLLNFLFFRGQPATVAPAVYETLERSAADDLTKVSIDNSIDRTNLIRVMYVLAAVLAVGALYKVLSPKDPFQTVSRVLLPWSDVAPPTRVEILEVQPGNKTATFGATVRITARLRGASSTDRVLLIYSSADQQVVDREIVMQPSGDGLHFEADLPPGDEGLQQDLGYRVQAGDAMSPIFRLELTAQPMIFVQRLDYQFPDYTQRRPQVVEGQGDIEALEGTVVTLRARANKTIQSAYLEWDPELGAAATDAAATPPATLPLECSDKDAAGTFTLALNADRKTPQHGSYQLRFLTVDGVRNDAPVPHRITVIPDIAPVVDVLAPRVQQVEIPENGRQTIEIRAVDPDFGLTSVELRGNSNRGEPWQHVLLEDPLGWKGQFVGKYDVVPAQLNLRSGDVLTYRAVARDNRRDAQNAPAANEELTTEYRIVVTPPLERPQQPPDAQPQNNQPGDPERNQQATPEDPQNDKSPDNQPRNQDPQIQDPQKQDPQNREPQPADNNQKPSDDAQKGSPMPADDQPAGGGAGQSGNNANNQKPQDGSQPDGPQAAGGQPGGEPSTDKNESPKNDSENGQPGTSQNGGGGNGKPSTSGQAGAPSGQRSSEDLHDGEAFDIIKRHLDEQRQQQNAAQKDPSQSPDGRPDKNPPDSGDNNRGDKPQPQPGDPASPDQRQAPGAPRPGAENAQHENADAQNNPQAPQPNSSRPAGDAQPMPAGQPPQPMPGSPTPKENGSPSPAQPEANGSPDPAQPKPDPRPGDSPSSPSPATPKSSDPGAGVDNDATKGPGQSPETNRDRPKSQDPASRKPEESQDPPGVSRSRNQSDSQGDKSGDRSGGGGQGSGQNAKLPGNDNAGSQQPAEDGSGAAPESGTGDKTDRPGDKQASPNPTGDADPQQQPGKGTGNDRQGGNEPGQPQNDSPQDNSPQDNSPQDNVPPPGDKNSDGQNQKNPAARKQENSGRQAAGGLPQGGGVEGEERPAGLPPPQTPINQGEPNLEYTRKATDLVLDYLKDQQQAPDKSLLDKLGWTPEELQEFVSRWEKLKQSADSDPESRRTLDETLRSLGMRPVADSVRSGGTVDDQQRGNTEAFRSSPPSKYLRQFNASRKGVARSQEDGAP
jgi:hypothetical protein